ncbi:MAG: DUF177 domain-containing protein [Synechococcales cyanobacterium RU_4_20]|nr:DUF177 domain-containing protein [Synechococcales cyanobacterium RU_4_20]
MEKKRSNSALKPILIPQLLQIPERNICLPVEDYLPELDTLTPIQGTLWVEHKGTYLAVRAEAKAIVTLACDRCLGQYNHRLALNLEEVIWLREAGAVIDPELEFEAAALLETLPPDGNFDPAQWLYEQVCLAIPPQSLCDAACEGIELEAAATTPLDSRWSVLAQLKTQIRDDCGLI